MFHRLGRRRRWLIASTAAVGVLACGIATAAAAGVPINPFTGSHAGTSGSAGSGDQAAAGDDVVGTQTNGSVVLPDNQKVASYGRRIEFTAESVGQAISPDRTKVAVQTGGVASGAAGIDILDASTGAILQTFGGRDDAPPAYSPDGTALYAASTTASGGSHSGTNIIYKYAINPLTGLVANPTSPQTLTLPGNQDLPFGLAMSSDGSTLYAALSASNELGVIDASTLHLVTEVPVGVAPAAVAVAGNEAFVTDRGGRIPATGDTTNTSAGTPVDVDSTTGATTSGTVSVVNLTTNKVVDTVNVGLQPGSITEHAGSLFVTNTNSDTVSIIDATTHKVTQTFNVEPLPGSTVGSSPTSVAFAGPTTLLVSVGGDNAIAEFGYHGPTQPVQYQGLIPTDWYPNQVSYDALTNRVYVSNEYGVGTDGAPRTSQVIGTESMFDPPTSTMLGTLTDHVFDNNGWNDLPTPSTAAHGEPGTSGGGDRTLPAIPTVLGQPSAIKHVFLIIKENQSYDGILGDLGKGNSDPAFNSWKSQVTPNQHSLATTFTDFDNFYNPTEQSADGHIWITQANPNDYLYQKQATNFARNANGQLALDPLNIQRSGAIWNTVQAAGKSIRIYGEGDGVVTGSLGTWQQYYADSQIMEGQASGTLPVAEGSFQDSSEIPTVNNVLDHDYPDFNLNIPDQYRVDVWDQEFQQQLADDTVPNLTILSLTDDHTGGTPTPTAELADNDLATGRVISEISHSSVWKDSAVFVEEDDTANDQDHVDAHRAPLFIASPYATRGVVNSDYYTVINLDKTIEQILGAQPLNQFDRAAVPMFDAFTNVPDDTPYDVVPNQVPLTQGVSNLIPLSPPTTSSASTITSGPTSPSSPATLDATNGPAAPTVPAAEQTVAAEWSTWDKTEAQPMLSGRHATADSANPAQLSRYDWYVATNWSRPFPGDKTILAPYQVPGRNLPSNMSGGD